MAINENTLFVKSDGTVYGCGYNVNGQLGIGTLSNVNVITKIDIDNIKTINCSNYHTIFLKGDGTVYGCGHNIYGQLGNGKNTNSANIIKNDMDNVTLVCCGFYHTIFLKNDGTVYSSGRNTYGQLGDGTTNDTSTPIKIDIDNVKSVYCGNYHNMILKNDGTVYSFGRNGYGQLGNGNTSNVSIPTKIDIDNVKSIFCGSDYTIFLKNDNTVYGCGLNNYGQLGNGTATGTKIPTKIDIDNVKSISCGANHTIFLKNDGTVYSCGVNTNGQLGTGNTNNALTPTKIDIDNVKSISCGNGHTIFLKNDGTMYVCGKNQYGQLGNNQTVDLLIPTEMDINVKYIFNQNDMNIILHLLKDNNVYKTITNGLLEGLGSELPSIDIIKEKGIENLNDLLIKNEEGVSLLDSLSDNFDILSYTDGDPLTKLKYDILPKPQIIKAKGDIGLNSFENINKVEVLTTGSGGEIKVAVSFDKGITWKTYIDGTWIDMSLDNTTFKEKGISLEQLSIIPNSAWNVGLLDKRIRFAYYLEYASKNDSLAIDSIKITADMLGTWKKARHGIDYDYEYSSNTSLLVNLLTDGTYKINYGEFNLDLPNSGNNSDSSSGSSVLALPIVASSFTLSDGYYKYRWVHNRKTKYMMISGVEASTGNSLLMTHQVIDENTIDIISSKACDTLVTAVF